MRRPRTSGGWCMRTASSSARVSSGVDSSRMVAACASPTEPSRSPTPVPCRAEMKCRRANDRNGSRMSSSTLIRSRCSGGRLSHLLTASTMARPRSSASPANEASWSVMPSRVSKTMTTACASSIACKVLTMLNFSIAALTRLLRRTPAVSTSV